MSPIISPSGGGGGGSQPGSSRIVVGLSNLPIPAGGAAIDWSFGTPFVRVVGTALAVVGADVVFVESGLYAVQVHLPLGVTDATDATKNVEAVLALSAGSQNADGDDDWAPAIAVNSLVNHPGALSCNYVWTQAAGATLGALLVTPSAGHAGVTNPQCRIVKLSDVAPDS